MRQREAVQEKKGQYPQSIADEPGRSKQAASSKAAAYAFRSFVIHMPGLCWIVDRKGDFHYMNPAYLKMFQLKRSDIGRNIAELFPQQIAAQYLKNNRKVFRYGKVLYANEDSTLPNGDKRTFRVVKFLLDAVGKQLLGGIAIDISDEIDRQNFYLHELERFRLISKAATDTTWDFDLNTGLYTHEGVTEKVAGSETGIGKEMAEFWQVHPDDLLRVQHSFQQKILSDDKVWEEFYRVRYNDEYRTIMNKAFIVRNKKGRAVRMVGAARYVLDEARLKEALVEKEQESGRVLVDHVIKAQERERYELSNELHENLAQLLVTASLLMDIAYEKSDKELMQQSRNVLQHAIGELRSLQQRLNPENIGMVGLKHVVQDFVQSINAKGKEKVRLLYNIKNHQLSPMRQVMLFRIIQEQLKNVLQHAEASLVDICLMQKGKEIELTITDNGKGFDTTRAGSGLGMKSIISRAVLLQGQLNLQSAPGKGCKLQLVFRIP